MDRETQIYEGDLFDFDYEVEPILQVCTFEEQLLYRNVQRFQGGLVFKAHRLLYHSTLGLRVIKKKKCVPSSLLLSIVYFLPYYSRYSS